MTRTLWVIGGRQGLGRAVAEMAQKDGGRWGLNDVLTTGVDGMDVTRPQEVYNGVNKILNMAGRGRLDVVYCAGVNEPAELGSIDPDLLEEHFRVNVMGFIYVMDALANMNRNGPCNVAAIVSDASRTAMRHSVAYCSSKAALAHAVRCVARELAPFYRVNGISPGIIDDTPMTRDLDAIIPGMRGWTEQQAQEYERSMIPMGRRANKEEVAELTLNTITGPHYQTGSIIEITGGK